MTVTLKEIISFRSDKLFNGAVNIGWFPSGDERAHSAAESYVFHGPTYHGVSQSDIGNDHGHSLQDTASFTRSVIRRCYGNEEEPFTLAIAGYGTGKSHLSLALASLLSEPKSPTSINVLAGLRSADPDIEGEIRAILGESGKPCLTVALNGMADFDLTTEITRQIRKQVLAAGLDTGPLDQLRPRFSQAADLIRMAAGNEAFQAELLSACDRDGVNEILRQLEDQHEETYKKVHGILTNRGINITVFGGESIKDIIDLVSREYCGSDSKKAFNRLAILFDEFGRYTEFATIRSHVAGSGVLQDLFEGIQEKPGTAVFIGFIQFELNAYVQRVGTEHRNEILRYITRYQSAKRSYLSINMETLIASLIEKKKPEIIEAWLDNCKARETSFEATENIARWFPQSRAHRLWNDREQFHTVIRKGCWPLSPYSTWFLYHLAAAGKHLQERSALALLGDTLERFANRCVTEEEDWSLAPVDFWSDFLKNELITAEESGQQGSITHAYSSVESRHGANLENDLLRMLKAVVLASKAGLKSESRDEAVEALAELAGLHLQAAESAASSLQHDFNALEWDEAFKAFDIIGDAVPRTQFLAFLRTRIANSFDEAGKAALFASKANDWCDVLQDQTCDFAEEKQITTKEWFFKGVTTSLDVLPMRLKLEVDRWKAAYGVNEPRGSVFYCYVEPERNPESVTTDVKRLLRNAAREAGVTDLPMLVILLIDTNGELGQAFAELAVIDHGLSEEDKARYGNLVSSHRAKNIELTRSRLEALIKERRYLTSLSDPLQAGRLSRALNEIFAKVYKKPFSFPFDGFNTAQGNAADTCQSLTREALLGKLDWSSIQGKSIKDKNRSVTVLKDSWGVLGTNGNLLTRPGMPVLRALTEKWDDRLNTGNQRLALYDSITEICLPPYGANIASAGLFLSLFVGPRINRLSILKESHQISVSQWLQEEIFKGKFLDLNALRKIELVNVGEASSEWDGLLNEWEEVTHHAIRKSFLDRALELKRRVPLPPTVAYHFSHLQERTLNSIRSIQAASEKKEDAIAKIEDGERRNELNQLTWGAASLSELIAEFIRAPQHWTEHQIDPIQIELERSRQIIIQQFPEWLGRQAPFSETPEAIAKFQAFMHRIGNNLQKLNLNDLRRQLIARTSELLRNVGDLAAANQLIRDVENWIASHQDALRFVRVSEVRALVGVARDYGGSLQAMSERVNLPAINGCRERLTGFSAALRTEEGAIVEKAKALWESKIACRFDIESFLQDVDSLRSSYENCDTDLEDFVVMQKALRFFAQCDERLNDPALDSLSFANLKALLNSEAEDELGEEETPWPINEVVPALIAAAEVKRKSSSESWLISFRSEVESISSLPVSEANRLRRKGDNFPPFLIPEDQKELKKILKTVVKHLEAIELEWLVDRYNGLPTVQKQRFLDIVGAPAP